jgi:hypothetical protein
VLVMLELKNTSAPRSLVWLFASPRPTEPETLVDVVPPDAVSPLNAVTFEMLPMFSMLLVCVRMSTLRLWLQAVSSVNKIVLSPVISNATFIPHAPGGNWFPTVASFESSV